MLLLRYSLQFFYHKGHEKAHDLNVEGGSLLSQVLRAQTPAVSPATHKGRTGRRGQQRDPEAVGQLKQNLGSDTTADARPPVVARHT